MARRRKRADGLIQKKFRIDGKQYVVYGHTEAELTEKEQIKREEIKQGLITHYYPTLSEYFERWLKNRRGTVSESTIRTQNNSFGIIKAVEVMPGVCIGDLKMREIDIEHLRNVQTALNNGRKSQTVNDYMALVKHIFSDALNERVIEYNPCKLLKNLKRVEEKARNTYHRALTKEETTAFFECSRCVESYYYNVFKFAINTGMRAGEIGGLKYADVYKGMIHVQRTITRTETGSYVLGQDAKTQAGRRVIPVTPQIKAIIKEQKKLNRLIDNGIVPERLFMAVEGGLLLATPLDREIKRICKEAGVEPFTMHAFRDTFATRAIESGMNPKTLQEILGHSNFNITMSLYGHCMENTKKSEMEKIILAI